MDYRGIRLHESVNLYKKDGSYNRTVKRSLDKLADMLKEKNHILKSPYQGNEIKILIDYQCGHDPHWVDPSAYKCNGVGCPKCSGNTPEQGKQRLIDAIKVNGHVLKSEYKGNKEKVLIDFQCGHKPHWIVPYSYYNKNGCLKCSGLDPKEAKKEFYDLIQKNGHVALSEYISANKKMLIDFQCGHKPNWATPNGYKSRNVRCPECGVKQRARTRLLMGEKAFRKLIKKNNHILVSEYKGRHEYVQIDFRCGHDPQWIHASSYYRIDKDGGIGCLKCLGRCPEEAKQDFFSKIESNGHEVMSEYKNGIKKVLVDYKCGHDPHWTIPWTYRNDHGCPKCGKDSAAKIYSEQARKEFPLLVESRGHKLLSPYGKNGTEKVLIDFQCGHKSRWIIPQSYKSNESGCIECGHIAMAEKQSQQSREEFASLVASNGHILLTSYGKNQYEKVLIDFQCRHKPHWTDPANYKATKGCPKCGHDATAKALLQQGEDRLLKAIEERNHTLLSGYKGAFEKVLINFHCGHDPQWVLADSYKSQMVGCNQCSQPKGEKIICDWLKANGFDYEIRFYLPNKNWIYDIFIPSENLIVEVNGLQHYQEVEYFKSRTLEEQQQIDRQKREYAESLGYEYLEIDYREHKRKLALERFLEAFKPKKKIRRSKIKEHIQLNLF